MLNSSQEKIIPLRRTSSEKTLNRNYDLLEHKDDSNKRLYNSQLSVNKNIKSIQGDHIPLNSMQGPVIKEVTLSKPLPTIQTPSILSTTTIATSFSNKEESCWTLLVIVLLFILTHSFRLVLKMYEVYLPNRNTSKHYDECFMAGR